MKFAISKDGTRIAYDVFGSGPVLIYITGAICHRNFKPVLDDAKIFAKEFSVITYDRRGRGDSGDHPQYSLEKEIDDINALINSCSALIDLYNGKVNIYGHSSGAILAMEAAIRLPSKIDKVFIYDPPYTHDEIDKAKYGLLREKVNQLISKKDYSAAIRNFLAGIGMPQFFVFCLPIMPGWKKLKALAPTLSYDMDMTKDFPPLEHLAEIKVPIKIVYGEKSPDSIQSVSKMITKAVNTAHLLELPQQDHQVSSKKLLPLLKEFFK
jgi:pimeloyl-ACP methyl ester carboxylesterase